MAPEQRTGSTTAFSGDDTLPFADSRINTDQAAPVVRQAVRDFDDAVPAQRQPWNI
jgi:hypothetical protein